MKQTLIFLCLIFMACYVDFTPVDLKDLQKETITVTVQGEVEHPGEIELQLYDTVDDALQAAVPNENADLTTINLSLILNDHDVVNVPAVKEEEPRISINSADVEELSSLPGIGESTAEKIIAYREEHGLFQTLDDLVRVNGIGTAKLEKIRDRITL